MRKPRAAPLPEMGQPDFTKRDPLPLVQIPIGSMNGVPTQAYRLGECSVIITREHCRWHLSIAHKRRYPTWDEIAEARYRLCPKNLTMALLLPPVDKYVNLHANCFQLHEIIDHDNGVLESAL